jgi:hypothetical protein
MNTLPSELILQVIVSSDIKDIIKWPRTSKNINTIYNENKAYIYKMYLNNGIFSKKQKIYQITQRLY